MRVVWDERKRLANIDKHGLDFAEFETGFDGETAMQLPTTPSSTGRSRFKLIGQWQSERVVVVITSPLGSEALSIVSLRHASPKESEAYERSQAGS